MPPRAPVKKITVRKKDNWFNLAEKYKISPQALAARNAAVKRLLPGVTVKVPLQAAKKKTPQPAVGSAAWERQQKATIRQMTPLQKYGQTRVSYPKAALPKPSVYQQYGQTRVTVPTKPLAQLPYSPTRNRPINLQHPTWMTNILDVQDDFDTGRLPTVVWPSTLAYLGIDQAYLEELGYTRDQFGNWIKPNYKQQLPPEVAAAGTAGGGGGYSGYGGGYGGGGGGGASYERITGYSGYEGGAGGRLTAGTPQGPLFASGLGLINWRI